MLQVTDDVPLVTKTSSIRGYGNERFVYQDHFDLELGMDEDDDIDFEEG